MAANVPVIRVGSGSATITFTPPKRMLLVANTDATDSLTVTFNGGGPDAWTLEAGDKKGDYVRGGVTTVAITATGGWQLEAFD